MKRSTITFVVLAAIFAFAGTMVFGQMMGGSNDHSMMQSEDSTGHCSKMGNMDMMKNMSGQCQMMSQDFSNWETHFKTMMQMDDITMLKVEMKKHYEMMQSMQEQMSKHDDKCQSMMGKMKSGGMQGGMMDKQAENSPGSGGHGH